jgi:hypothetical protein
MVAGVSTKLRVTTVSRWRVSTWAAIVWTALLWLFFAYLVAAAIKYGGAIYIDTAVFGGAGLLFWWLVGLGIVAVVRARSNRRGAALITDVGTAEGGRELDTAPAGGGKPNTIVQIAAAAVAGVIAAFAVSYVVRAIFAVGPAAILALVAGSAAAGAVLRARGWREWAEAVLLLLTTLFLISLLESSIRLLIEPA